MGATGHCVGDGSEVPLARSMCGARPSLRPTRLNRGREGDGRGDAIGVSMVRRTFSAWVARPGAAAGRRGCAAVPRSMVRAPEAFETDLRAQTAVAVHGGWQDRPRVFRIDIYEINTPKPCSPFGIFSRYVYSTPQHLTQRCVQRLHSPLSATSDAPLRLPCIPDTRGPGRHHALLHLTVVRNGGVCAARIPAVDADGAQLEGAALTCRLDAAK